MDDFGSRLSQGSEVILMVLNMKATLTISILVILVSSCGYRHDLAPNEIEYRGEKIKLTKSYSDFDDYKKDPENIDPAETVRVQRLVMGAPIEREFESLLDASKAVVAIAFPGYGSSGLAQLQQADGTVIMGFSVEIPRSQKERYFVFQGIDGKYRLVDDFVADEASGIGRVTEENGTLVYSTVGGEKILTRPSLTKR